MGLSGAYLPRVFSEFGASEPYPSWRAAAFVGWATSQGTRS
jgi:hypothetical protein